MKVMIISGTPKKEGLAISCVEAALEGVRRAGAEGEIIRLCDYTLNRCAMCGDGWGTCGDKHTCIYGTDGYNELRDKLAQADAVILESPVYWGEMTEIMKAFFDRLRRCEAFKGEEGAIAGKPILLIASPGGSGNGLISCLEQMERLSHHMKAKIFDYIGVNRWNKEYKLTAITEAAAAMVQMAE